MVVFDRYMVKNLSIATVFVAVTLSVVIILTQSLRFLELVIEAGASSGLFWVLTMLALPRFLEVILPVSLMAGVLFIYSRMISDSELVVMRASGSSPFVLARPAIILSMIVTVILMGMTLWVTPKSLRTMQEMRQEIKAQFSSVLFREGVFNQAGRGLTVYIRDKGSDGELRGIMIHDSRDASKTPSTVIAKRGVLVSNETSDEVLVFDGSRQEYDVEKGIFNRLNFERYTISLPNAEPVNKRWKGADERTIFELLRPALDDKRAVENASEFNLEIHRRFVTPFLALVFTLISACCLLLGPFDRRGQGRKIVFAVVCVTVMQGLYLSVINVAKYNDLGLMLMYGLVFVPGGFCLFLLSGFGEAGRRRLFFRTPPKHNHKDGQGQAGAAS